jgi:hypothetical protein
MARQHCSISNPTSISSPICTKTRHLTALKEPSQSAENRE